MSSKSLSGTAGSCQHPSPTAEQVSSRPGALALLHSSHPQRLPGGRWASTSCSPAAEITVWEGWRSEFRAVAHQESKWPPVILRPLRLLKVRARREAPSGQDKSLEIFSLDLCSKERARESSYCCRCSPSADREGERVSVGFQPAPQWH